MAKSNRIQKYNKPVRNHAVTDLTWWYTDLMFVPNDWKESRIWAAQALFHAKLNAVQFVDEKVAKKYRDIQRLKIDRQQYVNMIDPPTPKGGGGTAEFFASNFDEIPVATHLENIVRAKLDKIGIINKVQVNEIDKFAKSQRLRDKEKILYQREFRNLINEVNKELGIPAMNEGESPYSYVKKLTQGEEQGGDPVDQLSRLIENIKLQIKDVQDLQLYEDYVYKGDIERAFELAIEHYLINQNKWRLVSEFFIDDLKNFNRACGRWYPDQTTGRGIVEYIDPTRLYTSPFKMRNGDDIMYWFFEQDITFGDFVRQFGTTLTDEQLKQVFALNKMQGGNHLQEWDNVSEHRRNTCLIRIGYASFLTQEANTFSEQYINGRTATWNAVDLTWKPDTDSAEQKQKIYNVWHSFYYVPPPANDINRNSQTHWSWQANFIFNMEKDMDMYRYGVDQRYARSQLVIYKDNRPSFTDVKEAFMPLIRTTWHKFQNAIVQDTNAVIFDEDLLGGILNAADEANAENLNDGQKPSGGNGVEAGMAAWRAIRQGGMGFLKFRDKNGNLPDGFKSDNLQLRVDSGHLDKAEKYLQIILQQYELMKLSLAQSDITEGQAPKPRTAVAGIQASIEAANNAMWFIEKPVREFLIMFGERCVQSVLCMVKEKKKYGYEGRWKEFQETIGLANALLVEGIEDLEPEAIGLTVSLEDTSAMADRIEALAYELAASNKVGWDAVGLVVNTAKINYKYAYALLMLSVKEQQRKAEEAEALAFERQMALKQQDVQLAQALQGVKTQGNIAEINAEAQAQAMLQQQQNGLKYQTQSALKEQTTQNRILEKQEAEKAKANAENQEPLI